MAKTSREDGKGSSRVMERLVQHKAPAPEAPSVPCRRSGPPSTRDAPSNGMSTAASIARIPEFLAVEILDCDGWVRTGALGEDKCHQEPSGRTSATRLPADATALPGERSRRTRTVGSSRALAASLAGKTRTLLSPEAFLRRVPSRGLAVLFLCRVLFLQVIFSRSHSPSLSKPVVL